MIHGYKRRAIDKHGLLEMKEVTLSFAPDDLREVAKFLMQMADEMESGAFEPCSHQHISSVVRGWSKKHAEVDIIVAPPVEDPE